MNKHQKVAVIVWTIDPEGNRRFLLRHNKPFNGYEDEWTIAFGDIEPEENLEDAAKREASEEFGLNTCQVPLFLHTLSTCLRLGISV